MPPSVRDTGNLWLARALWDLGAIQFGDFALGRSTLHSPIYINLRLLISNPQALQRAARVMYQKVQTLQQMRHPHAQPFQRISGIPFGGLHLATAFSLRSKIPMIYAHPSKPGNGSSEAYIEGRYQPGETVLLIDDLITTGGAVIEAGSILRQQAGLTVNDVLVVLDRQEGARERLHASGYNLISILELEPTLNYLMSSRLITEERYRTCIDYIRSRRSEPPS